MRQCNVARPAFRAGPRATVIRSLVLDGIRIEPRIAAPPQMITNPRAVTTPGWRRQLRRPRCGGLHFDDTRGVMRSSRRENHFAPPYPRATLGAPAAASPAAGAHRPAAPRRCCPPRATPRPHPQRSPPDESPFLSRDHRPAGRAQLALRLGRRRRHRRRVRAAAHGGDAGRGHARPVRRAPSARSCRSTSR